MWQGLRRREQRGAVRRMAGGKGWARTALLAVVLLALSWVGAGRVSWAQTAPAGCAGSNLLVQLPPQIRARIAERVAQTPHAHGILWEATQGDRRITLVGTYHFDDPRHADTLAALRPALRDAAALFVEAGPAEEARLTRALTEDPSLMVAPSGPTLPERLTPEEWQALSAAMEARGTPAFVAARLRPWYVSMMLGMSPCMLRAMAAGGEIGGLDHQLIALAQARDLPVQALEPWDTIFDVFAGLSEDQETDMIRAALPAAVAADDYAATLTDSYFAADVWSLWEFTRQDAYAHSGLSRAEVDAQMALARRKLMDDRNRAWIGPLTAGATEAAREGRGIVAGFGALHLPGEHGVLSLLAAQGWQLRRLDG